MEYSILVSKLLLLMLVDRPNAPATLGSKFDTCYAPFFEFLNYRAHEF